MSILHAFAQVVWTGIEVGVIVCSPYVLWLVLSDPRCERS